MATLKGKKVGTSTITAGYGSLTSNGVVLTVSALDLSLSGTNCVISGLSNITYNGSAHKTHPTVTAKVGGTQTTLTEGTDYTLSWSSSDSNACTAVGTITVTVTGKGNFSGSKTATYQITNATITVKTSGKTSVTNQSYEYSGSEQGVGLVATTVNNQTATIKYKVGTNGTYSTTVPQITNVAQSTTIYYEVTAPNHGTVTGSYSLTIINKSISIPTPTGATKTYDGAAYSASFPAATGATVTKYRYDTNGGSSWTESTTAPTRTNVGTTTVQAYYTAGTNYTGSGWSSTASIKINAADFTVSAGNQSYPWTGNAQGSAITVTNLKGSQSATIQYKVGSGSYSTTVPKITNVSESPTTVSWQVTAPNHNTQTGSYTITITPPAISIPAPTSNEKTYTGTTYYATFPAASYATITSYQTSTNGKTWSDPVTSNPGKSTQGTIYVRACYTADGNHSGSGFSAAATIKINPAAITVSAPNQSYPYDGASHGNAISATTVNSQTATIQYKVGSSGTYSTAVPKVTVVGNNATIYYQVTAPNHNTATGSYTLNISTVAITATATDQSKVYDGSALSAAATGSLNKDLPVGHSVTYGVSGSQTTVGSSTKTLESVTIKNGNTDVSANYDITKVNGTLTVTNASFTVSAPNQTYTYNGSAQGAAITVTNLKGSQTATIKYGTTSGTYNTTTVPTQTTANPGSPKTVYWQVTAPNHATQTGSYTITVNRATPTFTLAGETKVFHTTAYIKATASVAGTVHWGTSASSMTSTTTVSAGTATNVTSRGDSDGVGTTTIYAYFTPTDTTNYNSVGSSNSYSQSESAKITASNDNDITISVSSNLAYTGANQVIATKTGGEGCASFTLGYSTTSNGTVTWGTKNATTLSVAGPGTYYIHYKVEPDTNHSRTIDDKQIDATAVINSGTLTITITGYSGTYDATAHNIVASTSNNPSAKNQEGTAVTGVTYTYSASENGTYSTSLTRTNATGTASNENATATYWVKAEKSGYTTAKKSFTVYIARAANPLTISPTSKTIYNTSGYNTFTITPSGAQGTVTYSSNATSKASVSSSGVVTYVAAGTGTVITVTAAGNDNYKSGSKTCTVNTVVDTVSTYGDITGNITISQKKQFPAGGVTLSTSNISTYFDYSSTAAQTLTWASGNTTSGTISHAWSGTSVTIPSLGTSETSTATERTISFTVTATGEGSKTKSASVSSGNQEANPVTGISLALAQTTIVYGNTTTTTVTATYKSGETGTITPTSVSSSNDSVAEVL